jgi:hypothetical protein
MDTPDIFSGFHDETAQALGSDAVSADASETASRRSRSGSGRKQRASGSASRSRGTQRASNRLTRAVVSNVIEKYEQVASLDAEQSRFLAASLGLPPESDAKDIVSVVYSAATNINPVAIVDKLRGIEDPVERYIAALSLQKTEQKSVWNLLTGVTDASGRLPGDDRQAAKRLIDALSKVDELTLIMLSELKALGSR